MAIILKNNTLDAGTEKLYRDALVSEGTLTCLDFSNYGCLTDGNLTTVKDLALESKEELGILNDISFNVPDESFIPSLNNKKGYPSKNIGSPFTNSYSTGLNINNIDNYLFENQPKSLFIVWLDANGNDGTEPLEQDSVIKSGDSLNENIRFNGGGGKTVSIRFGGVGFGNYILEDDVVQMAIEFTDNETPLKLYINGKFHGFSTANGYGFKSQHNNNPITIGQKKVNTRGILNFYRVLIEDLDASGRTALEVVEKDFNYVNANGEYEGITPRPFKNI